MAEDNNDNSVDGSLYGWGKEAGNNDPFVEELKKTMLESTTNDICQQEFNGPVLDEPNYICATNVEESSTKPCWVRN